jgi:exonuclease III
MMKIATWNLDRPKSWRKPKNSRIIEILREIDADILVLTETNSCINPGETYRSFASASLAGSISRKGEKYEDGENRVTIWSKYEGSRRTESCDSLSSICAEIKTPVGVLIVYGTVIGVYGNRDKDFISDLEQQMNNWRQLYELGNLCIAGDYNLSLGNNFYYTKDGRQKIVDCFQKLKIIPLTSGDTENIDHIAISEPISKTVKCEMNLWNKARDRNISDHMAVCVRFERLDDVIS